MKSRVAKTLFFLFVSVFLISSYKVYQLYSECSAGKAQYAALEQYVATAVLPSSPEPSHETDEDETAGAAPESPQSPQVNFDELRKINPDIVGWLAIDGTQINYPVVQGNNNEFYLTHRFDGQPNSAGCLFLDAQNDATFRQPNQIIYGHYMKNRSMLYNLAHYKDQEFFSEHPTGWIITERPLSAMQRFCFGWFRIT